MRDSLKVQPPEYLKSIEPEAEPIIGGCFAVVNSFKDLPANVWERFSDELQNSKTGYVIKEYIDLRDPKDRWVHAAKFPSHALAGGLEGTPSIPAQGNLALKLCEILKKRQSETGRFFGKDVEGGSFVVKSEFLVGKKEDKAGNPFLGLYEVQEKIVGESFTSLFHRQKLEIFLNSLDEETKQKLKSNLLIFKEKLAHLITGSEDPVFSKHFPDLNFGNVFLTLDGKVKIVDTNMFLKINSEMFDRISLLIDRVSRLLNELTINNKKVK